jgi:NAD+ diphosphatase
MDVTLPYNGLTLDRARRADPEWLAGALAGGRVLAFW